MMKRWSLFAVAGVILGAVSCTPVGGTYPGAGERARGGVVVPNGGVGAAPAGSTGTGERMTSGDLRKLREQREAAGGERVIHPGRNFSNGGVGDGRPVSGNGGSSNANDEVTATLPPLNIDYRYAMPVPGRKGWVYNPYTNRPVDVRGVESGRLIYDERDPANRNEDGTLRLVPEMPNKFRVP